jgi:hypothetical protein
MFDTQVNDGHTILSARANGLLAVINIYNKEYKIFIFTAFIANIK